MRLTGGHEVGGQTASTQHQMDQSPPDPSVAVDEGVDCLELGVSDRGLH